MPIILPPWVPEDADTCLTGYGFVVEAKLDQVSLCPSFEFDSLVGDDNVFRFFGGTG